MVSDNISPPYMLGVRSASAALEHLAVEVAMAPFVSEVAFRRGLIALTPSLREADPIPNGPPNATRALWQSVVTDVRMATFLGPDEATILRDSFWFGTGGSQPVPLHQYLTRLSSQLLDGRGRHMVPRLPEGWPATHDRDARARRLWRWAKLAMPEDVLAAPQAQACHNGKVDCTTPDMLRWLRKGGFAEVHCHLGAACRFSTLWSWTLRAMADERVGEDAFASPGAALDGGRELAPWLLRWGIVRCLLAKFLAQRRGHGAEPFEPFLATQVKNAKHWRVPLAVAIDDLLRGQLSGDMDHIGMRECYAFISGVRDWPWQSHGAGAEGGPVAHALPVLAAAADSRPAVVRFVRYAADYLADEAPTQRDQDHFATLFWQGMRVRNLFYRHVTLRPDSGGLLKFMMFSHRSRPVRQCVPIQVVLSTARALVPYQDGLRALEMRINGNDDVADNIAFLERAGDQLGLPRPPWMPTADGPHKVAVEAATATPAALGIVIHFGRDRGGGMRDAAPSARGVHHNADPGWRRNNGYRFGHYYVAQWRRGCALADLFVQFPLALTRIRAIDVCSDELGVPTWVIRPLFQHVRRAAATAEAWLGEQNLLPRLDGLRATAHAGEDYVHLLTGLRRVSEAVEHLLRARDRLGHAMALGEDPARWALRKGVCAMPREVRLFDLVWERQQYLHGAVAGNNRYADVENELLKHAHRMFPRHALNPVTITDALGALYQDDALVRAGFLKGTTTSEVSQDAVDLVTTYLTDPETYQRGRESVLIDPTNEIEPLQALQAHLRDKVVSRRGIVVEINPSSNLLVGDLAAFEHHPFWCLSPPIGTGSDNGLKVCIGTDDPLVFATTLPEEYQLLYDSLRLRGIGHLDRWAWMDRVRQTSLDHCFVQATDGALGVLDNGRAPPWQHHDDGAPGYLGDG